MKFLAIILFLLPFSFAGQRAEAATGGGSIVVCDTLSRKEVRTANREQKEQERVVRQRGKQERRDTRGGASQPSAESSRREARMVLPVSTFNFGDIRRKGGDLVKEFTFRNEGTAPLVLIRVITSCHCLRASFPKRPVAPGGEGKIKIVYEPNKSEEGMFNKVIQIYSNSVTGREVITVQGNSIDGELPGENGRKNKD